MENNCNDYEYTISFLNRLSQQLLQVQKGHWTINCQKISEKREKLKAAVVVKLEGDTANNDMDYTATNDESCQWLTEKQACSLCMQSCSSIIQKICQCNYFSDFGDEINTILQEIFQTSSSHSLNGAKHLGFCNECAQAVSNLCVYYRTWKNAEREYKDALLRIKCFKRCAQNAHSVIACDVAETYKNFSDDSFDHFSETTSYDCIEKNVEDEQNILESSETGIEFTNFSAKTKRRKEGTRNKYNYKGKPVRRRGGLTEEEYQEHRRIQMARYYQEKKRKTDSLETEVDPGQSCTGEKIKTTPLSASKKMSKHKTRPKEQLETTKKKYDYKGKTIRRRGGLTEEEYQEHRRAQSAHYYFQKKRKLGKLNFGPKPLSAVAKARLEKVEKACLDSHKMPAKSSCGISVPVISLEPTGKRFSYRNVEFTKENGVHNCCKCGHTTKVLNVMKKHIAKIHFDKEHGYKCSQCNKTFYYQFQLRNHEGRHTEKGARIQCEECGQSFKYSAGYYHHRRTIHQGIKPHECKDCEKQFGTRKDLRKHMESKSHQNRVNNSIVVH